MTGSGKTGLGIDLIEEAALDKVPVIAVDPKGDLGNLLLTFPDLTPEDFKPWMDPQQAAQEAVSTEELARQTAELWSNGLADWDQGPDRIRTLKDSATFRIYTPGSSAGLPISVLGALTPPEETEGEAFTEQIEGVVSSLLSLLGIEADPLQSPEHVVLSKVVSDSWTAGKALTLADFVNKLEDPPPSLSKIGEMELEDYYPAKKRKALAMKLNSLLAAPGFEMWKQGTPLKAEKLLYTDEGTPRVSVLSIAHLSDAERMFFLTRLLGELVGWMRRQSGTGSLRAILYIDEIFGYLPPTANPPSKTLLLTLLKQARAFGIGVVLATQNSVDIDYKALSNCGTWFVGRLQTERDKERLLDGLEGASQNAAFDKKEMDTLISGLGKRTFLFHNVHEAEPTIMRTRWAMSYLAGPMTRDQIAAVMKGLKEEPPAETIGSTQEQEAATEDARRFRSPTLDITSEPGESEADFRKRLTQIARERRDEKKEEIRETYRKRTEALEKKMRTAEQRVERESAQHGQRKLETIARVGTSLLGAFLGGKKLSRTNINQLGTAARSASRMGKEKTDVELAQANLDGLQEEYAELEAQLQEELDELDLGFSPETEKLEVV